MKIFHLISIKNIVSQWVTSRPRCALKNKIILFWVPNLSLSWHLINEVYSSVSKGQKHSKEKIMTLDTSDTWELHSSEASYSISNKNNNHRHRIHSIEEEILSGFRYFKYRPILLLNSSSSKKLNWLCGILCLCSVVIIIFS